MKITSKNLKTVRKKLVTMACKIAHLRDKDTCRFCGKSDGQQHASHIVPRSRGWQYGANPRNIKVLCARCHLRWHEAPLWGARQLAKHCPELADYWKHKTYAPKRLTVADAEIWAAALEKELAKYDSEG